MTENYKQDADSPTARIHPKIFDVVLVSSVFLVSIVILTIGRWNILQKKQYFIAFTWRNVRHSSKTLPKIRGRL